MGAKLTPRTTLASTGVASLTSLLVGIGAGVFLATSCGLQVPGKPQSLRSAGEASSASAPAPAAPLVAAGLPAPAHPVTLPLPASAAPAAAPPAPPPARAPWQPPDVPRRPFAARVERWRPLVRELLAEAWNEGRLDGHASTLDDDLILAVIQQESDGDPEAVSWAGAMGLMQVMPFTFADMMHGDKSLADEIDSPVFLDVHSNVRAGIRYLALAMHADEGNLYWSLAAYNAGIEAVDDWRAAGLYAVPPIGGYEETAYYAPTILRNYLRHRPGLQMYIPPVMPDEHVPGAIRLLKEAGRW